VAIEADLRTVLLTYSALTALVGTRIHPDVLPQQSDEEDNSETLPAVVIDVMDETPQNTLDGGDGMVVANVGVRCFALTKALARQVAEAIRVNGTDPGTGLAAHTGYADGGFDGIHIRTEFDVHPLDDGQDRVFYEVSGMYQLTFSQTT